RGWPWRSRGELVLARRRRVAPHPPVRQGDAATCSRRRHPTVDAGRRRVGKGAFGVDHARNGRDLLPKRVGIASAAVQIKGNAAVVTGAASGLGAATARRLAGAGAEVTVLDLDRQAEKGEALAKELGGPAKFAAADVTDTAQVEQAIAVAAEGGAPLRIAVNCAGLGIATRTLDRSGSPHDLEAFRFVLNVNLIGTFSVL